MRAFARACLCLLLLAAAGLFPPPDAKAEPVRKSVLFLNSYHNGYAWSDDILTGLRSFFAESGYAVDLQIEYMDTKRFATPEREKSLYEFYREKFKGAHFDIIIASDDFAYNFILDYQDKMLPGVPVVFCGVNDFRRERLAGHSNITGVVENVDFESTLRLAARLHPNLHRMIVIGDRSVTGAAIQRQIREVVPRLQGILDMEFWDDLPLGEIMERLGTMPKDAMLFVIPVYLERDGKLYSADEVVELISANVNMPVYSCWRFLLGHGLVGGRLHSGVDHGRMAARQAFRIMTGEKPANVPVVDRFDDPYAFDYVVLRKLDIPTNELPSGSDIINEPYAFYTINKGLFWTIIVSLMALIFILVLLVASISQRRRIQERVNDQLSFLKILMDAIPLPIYSLDRNSAFQDCNLAFERFFGTTREGIAGKLPQDIGDPALAEADCLRDEVDRQLLAAPGSRIYECSLDAAHGGERSMIVSKATYLNAKGETMGLVGVLSDVTGLKRAEEELRQAEEKYRGIFENSVLGIFRAAPDGTLLDANRALLDMLGQTDLAALREMGAGFLAGDAAEAWLTAAPGPGGAAGYRREIKRPDGQRMAVFLHIRGVADSSGNLLAFEGIVEDITKREEAERALHESQRMLLQSQKMEAIGTLAGGIAHDFNNILTTILNSAELALLDLEEGSEMTGDILRVLKASQRGSQLVRQILAFSRPSQAGFEAVNVAEVVRETLSLLSASLPRNITVREDIRRDPALALADPIQLHQVFLNLCTNAFQAMRETGGDLLLTLNDEVLDTASAETLSLPPGHYLRLCISDTGPGIPQNILSKIFDPFFTTKGKAEGTGLGLAVVHGIITAHKGAVAVSSIPWERTSFDIYLPLLEREGEADQSQGEQVRRGQGRILFVEDDQDQLATIPRVLGRLGYEVTPSASATLALATLAENPDAFDLVLTDFDMPGVNGVEFARRLAVEHQGLPVVMVSGRLHAGEMPPDLPPNILRVLAKPYSQSALSEALREILSSA
ncbi:hybrid sensor histidine kinase/response regulator [Humidesulfovibrio sp.]|uniref:hybrid sensor histidine kinase/response regulator n=1 Tax=Humidesulfovibrio sp. TaxID=2910988 RepID=UPI00280B6EED|nr:PAS domain S-box protein [Humidesulfovibrio sp.]